MTRGALLGAAVAVAVCVGVQVPASGNVRSGATAGVTRSHHHPDFDGDGFAELVIQNPRHGAGEIWVLYGAHHGAASTRASVRFDLARIFGAGTQPHGGEFGRAVAAADFNGDGYDDLAIGAPVSSGSNEQVVVLYGSRHGLIASGAQRFSEASLGFAAPGPDEFGYALAAGDLNDDGRADLVIGAPFRTVGTAHHAGAVIEIFGSSRGLGRGATSQVFDESTPGVLADPSPGDQFGGELTAGDVNGDGFSDVALRVFGRSLVDVLRGSPSGLTAQGSQYLHPGAGGVPSTAEWGSKLATADINADGRAELMIGDPEDAPPGGCCGGSVVMLFGTSTGVTTAGALLYRMSNTTWTQPDGQYYFGGALAPIDFDGDGHMDLAIGAPTYDGGCGGVVVLHNLGNRLSRTGGFVLTRRTPGMIGPCASFDDELFGDRLAAGDFSGNGCTDLAVSLPGLDVSGAISAGGVQTFYGTPRGFGTNDALFTANTLGGTSVAYDEFGWVRT